MNNLQPSAPSFDIILEDKDKLISELITENKKLKHQVYYVIPPKAPKGPTQNTSLSTRGGRRKTVTGY